MKDVETGDYIKFGVYEQDNDKSNGKEEVEWRVLEVKDGKALVISRYVLDYKKYGKWYESVTWNSCSLRKWLNDTFLDTAFSTEEQSMISTVTVQDKVFLLSITEANKYFAVDSTRKCMSTDYVDSKRTTVYKDGTCNWWLRSSGSYYRTVLVLSDGSVYEKGQRINTKEGVRPAMWIDLSTLE